MNSCGNVTEEGRGADALDGRLNSLINIDLVGFNGI